MKITETVRGIVEQTVCEMGFRVYDVEFQKEPEGYVLTVYIDADAPVTLDDCEKVSRAIEPLIDESDPITQAYYLSVSSVGIDRPLTIEEDYKRNVGKEIDVKLYTPLDDLESIAKTKRAKSLKNKQFTGILTEYDDTSFTVTLTRIGDEKVSESKVIRTEKKDAATIRPHIDFDEE